MIHFGIYDSPGGQLLADYTHKATGVRVATNERGFAECQADIPLSLPEAFIWHDRPGLPHVLLTDNGYTLYEGRLEDPGITGDGLSAAALGYSQALSDLPYTALWSTTSVAAFQPILTTQIANRNPDLYAMDQQSRLNIGLTKNTTYANNTDAGSWYYQIPDDSGLDIVHVQFEFTADLPANWVFRCVSLDASFGSQSALFTFTSAGVAVTRAAYVTLGTTRPIIAFDVFNSTGAGVTFLAENDTKYGRVSYVRIATNSTLVSTTLGTNIAAGAQTVTPGSMANIYVGQKLVIGNGLTTAEQVIVTAITSTTFTATFANAHNNTDPVRAIYLYADQIAAHLVGYVNTNNPTQISTSTAPIQSPGLDLTDEVYEDTYGANILNALIAKGDNQVPPRRWEWGIWEGQRLIFQPRGQGRTWYIDVTDLEVIRTLANLFNEAYAIYQESSGRTLRTPIASNVFSVTKYGVKRRQGVTASTTLDIQAQVTRDAAVNDAKDPLPQARIAFDAVYNEAGARVALSEVRAGDTFVIRNLPPTLSTSIDRIRTFRLTRTELDLDAGELTVEPEAPLPTLEVQLAEKKTGGT